MPELKPFLPLRHTFSILPLNDLGVNLNGEFFDLIGIEYFEIDVNEGEQIISINAALAFIDEIVLEVPNSNGLALVINSDRGRASFPFSLMFGARSEYAIRNFQFKIRIPREVIRKAKRPNGDNSNTSGWEQDNEGMYEIILPSFDLVLDGNLQPSVQGSISLSLSPGFIGDTGIVFEAENMGLYLDSGTPPPAGRSTGWTGFFIERLSMYLPEDFVLGETEISLENAGIGNDGFFGEIALEWENTIQLEHPKITGPATGTFLGIYIALKQVQLTFNQNIPVSSLIEGQLILPFFNQILGLDFNINANGDINLGLSAISGEEANLFNVEIKDLLKFDIQNIRIIKENEIGRFEMAGSLQPLVGGLNFPSFNINKLSIDTNGQVAIDGSWINLPSSTTLNFHGFKINLSQFGFGNEEKDGHHRQWLGVSGEIQLIEGLPIKGSVEGLKFSWLKDTAGEGLKVTLRGIGVEFKIPGTLEFAGSVEYVESPTFDGFKGQVSVKLIPLRTEVAGTLMVGKGRDAQGREFGVFYIQLMATLPTALPLGATGTGLFGIRGLVGINVAPTKTDEQTWYDWYKATPEYNVVDIRKWQPLYDNYAFGAGIQLGTIYDDGTTLNLGAMLVVLIPGPVIMLEGKANLLKVRAAGEGSQREEGAFYLLAVLDGRAGTFQLNIDVRYSLQDVVRVTGGLEAFFDFNNDQNWYLNIGRKEPDSKRIQAEVLALFRANVYFMISPQSLQLGAFVGLNIRETFGPVSFALVARISFDLSIFFKPFQLEGRLELMAEIALTIFGIGLKLLLQMILEGKTPNPFEIYGKGKLALSLPFPLPSFDFEVELRWTGPDNPQPVPRLLKGVAFIHHKAKDWERKVTVENFEEVNPEWSNCPEPDQLPSGEIPEVAVDCTPVLTFAKRIHNLRRSDNSYANLIDEGTDAVSGKKFAYELQELVLEKYTGAEDTPAWSPVKAGVNQQDADGKVPPSVFKLLRGDEGESSGSFLNGIDAKEPAIQLWQYKPYEFTNTFQRDNINALHPPCGPADELAPKVIHWKDEAAGKTYPHIFTHQDLLFLTDRFLSGDIPLATPRPYVGDPLFFSGLFGSDIINHIYTHFDENRKCLRTNNTKIIFPEILYNIAVYVVQGMQESETPEPVPSYISAFRGSTPVGSGVRTQLPDDGTRVNIFMNDNLVEERPLTVFRYEVASEQGFDHIRIEELQSADQVFWIQSIEYITLQEYRQNRPPDTAAAPEPLRPVAQDLVLEPNSAYRLKVVTGASNGAGLQYYRHTDYFFFRTGAGPGIPEDNASASPVGKAETYVNRTLPKNGAPAHYYGYDINVVFNEAYFEKLYGTEALYLRLRDRNGKPAAEAQIGNFTPPEVFSILYGDVRALTWLSGLMEGPGSRDVCRQRLNPPIWNPAANFPAVGGMQPSALYTAELFTRNQENTERPLYQFQFTTSKYATFQAHFSPVGDGYTSRVVNPVSVRLEELETIIPASDPQEEGVTFSFRAMRSTGGIFEQFRENRRNWRSFVEASAQADTSAPSAIDISHLSGLRLLSALEESSDNLAKATHKTFEEIYARIETSAFLFVKPDGSQIDMRNRSLPPHIEFIQIPLTEENSCLVLLESPEPVEWNRISGTVQGETIGFLPNQDATRVFLVRGLTLGFQTGIFEITLNYNGESDGQHVQTENIPEAGDGASVVQPVNETVTFRLTLWEPAPQLPVTPSLQAFIHVSHPDNIQGGRSELDHISVNAASRAFIFPARVWGNERFGTGNPNTIGVQFTGARWAIVYQDPALPMVADNSFHVLVVPGNHPNAFIHTATAANTLENRTYLDHPLTNLRPNVYLLVAQRGAVLNNHELCVRFDLERGRWYIFNKVSHAGAESNPDYRMPLNAQFNVLAIQGNELSELSAFSHQVRTENILHGSTTVLDHPVLNAHPAAMVFFSECWRQDFLSSPDALEGAPNEGIPELWYDHPDDIYRSYRNNHWMLYNANGANMISGQGFNLFVWRPLPNLTFVGFKHTVTASSSQSWTAPFTSLDHMHLNDNPDAMVFVTSNWGIGATGADNPYHFRVDYHYGRWRIHNQQANAIMNTGYVFNVLIAPDNCPNVFIHRADSGNLSMNRTYIDHPLCNNRPNAYLMATPRGTVVNDRAIIIAYEAVNGRWFIANQINPGVEDPYDTERHGIPTGAEFNVLVADGPELMNVRAFSHLAEQETIKAPGKNISFLDHELLNRNPHVLFFAMPAWRPDRQGASYNNSPVAIWFDDPEDAWDFKEGYWSVYNCVSGVSMPPDMTFNIFVLT